MSVPSRVFDLVENYIYIYQLDKYVIVPVYPETVSDTLGSTFSSTNALARTAPIQAYSNSGPRKVQLNLMLHRDLMTQLNYNNTSFVDKEDLFELDDKGKVLGIRDDYVDTLVNYLQAMALPSFNDVSKLVNAPMIAVRFGNTLFIKGVINGDVGVTYSGPISADNKYQQVEVSFAVTEVDPYDANSIAQWGSFRGLESVLTKNLTKA